MIHLARIRLIRWQSTGQFSNTTCSMHQNVLLWSKRIQLPDLNEISSSQTWSRHIDSHSTLHRTRLGRSHHETWKTTATVKFESTITFSTTNVYPLIRCCSPQVPRLRRFCESIDRDTRRWRSIPTSRFFRVLSREGSTNLFRFLH